MIDFEDLEKAKKENFSLNKIHLNDYRSGLYTNIKFLKGKAIDKYQKELRNGTKGVSTENYGNIWFHLEKGKAIFKDYDGYQNIIKKIRITNELLCYELAHYQDEYGVVTYDVAKKNEKLMSLNEVCDLYRISKRRSMQSLPEIFNKLKFMGYKINTSAEYKKFYKIALFDSLTAQSDRNINNIFMLFNEETKKVTFAPLIDNEFAFNAQNLNRHFEQNLNINISEMRQYLNYIYKTATVVDSRLDDSLYRETISQLVNVARKNNSYAKILKQQIDGYDVKTALKNLEKQGVKVGEKYTNHLLRQERMIKNIFKLELKKQQDKEIPKDYDFIK